MKIHTFLSDTFLKIVSKYTSSFHTVSPPPKKYENSNNPKVLYAAALKHQYCTRST